MEEGGRGGGEAYKTQTTGRLVVPLLAVLLVAVPLLAMLLDAALLDGRGMSVASAGGAAGSEVMLGRKGELRVVGGLCIGGRSML